MHRAACNVQLYSLSMFCESVISSLALIKPAILFPRAQFQKRVLLQLRMFICIMFREMCFSEKSYSIELREPK